MSEENTNYGDAWVDLTLKVYPTGEFHVISGHRAEGGGDTPFLGIQYLTSRFERQQAERIAELEATVEEQRRTIEALVVPVEEAIGKEGSSAIILYIAGIENQLRAVEANNARLREALAFIAEDTSEYSNDYRPPYAVAEEALEETPANSLATVRREAICVPVRELEKLEESRIELYDLLSTILTEEQVGSFSAVTGQIWKVANTKEWS